MSLKDFSVLKPIPKSLRKYRGLDLFLLWAGGNTCLATIFTGGLIGPSLGIKTSLMIILLAATLGGIFLGLIAIIGYREGLPTMVLTRKVVSNKGSYVASALNAFQLIGWTSVLLYFSAEAMSEVFKSLGIKGLAANIVFWIIVLGELETVYTAIGPERWLLIQRIAVTTLMVALIYETWGLARAFRSKIFSGAWMIEPNKLLWSFDMVLATAISWAPLVADYSRFSKTPEGSFHGTCWGYSVTSYVLYFIGAMAAVLTGAFLGDPTEVIIKLGLSMSIIFLIFIGISAVTTNLLNLYSATVSIQNIRPRIRYSVLVYLLGNISILFSVFPVFVTYFSDFLTYIGVTFIPLTTVLILHYLYKEVSVKVGLISWALGGIAGLCAYIFLGYGSTLISLATTILAYYVSQSFIKH